MHDFGFLRGGGAFFSSCMAAPLLFSHSFYILGNPVSILQNSPPLSRQFTFKYFNNYFPKKREIALNEIFKL